jgi:hypothetical protein
VQRQLQVIQRLLPLRRFQEQVSRIQDDPGTAQALGTLKRGGLEIGHERLKTICGRISLQFRRRQLVRVSSYWWQVVGGAIGKR